jgi:hypothetical protein
LSARIKAQVEAGTFVFSDVFPKFKGLRKLPGRVCAKSCGEVFDAFLRHEEARVVRDDLAPITQTQQNRRQPHGISPVATFAPISIATAIPSPGKRAFMAAFSVAESFAPMAGWPAISITCW